ncbi:response regulator [Roseomonas sp. USHLN139]|uniref:response regulator n=1 Tax=Roseomonas sp. USHLN139 TaxID=3081298 RepID=UPI003B0188C9
MNELTETRLLAGRTILVVEDQYVIAEELVQLLLELGATVIGPFARAEIDLAAQPRPDAALLDIHLHGRPVFELADRLRQAGVPLLFLTGYDASVLPPAYQDLPCLPKPVDPRRLELALARLLPAPRADLQDAGETG